MSFADESLKSISTSLKTQLFAIESELQADVDNALSDLRIKRQHDSNFNITLFGRTMVGKSTLMSILTHSNENAIGKGGQRTTRDVREYEWNGMSVTDVPGIDSFEGEEDDRTAEIAAKNADLIVFMISSGQPESIEADWLIKLKKEDKAILCLCNYKSGLEEKAILKKTLNNKDAFLAKMDLDGLKIQFNSFLRTELPNEHIDIHVAMLLAEQLSHKPEYKNIKKDLLEISQFADFKKAIIAQVNSRGIFYRRKSYLALIDAPIYIHYLKLLQFANDTFAGWMTVHQKQEEFRAWQRDFNREEKDNLRKRIDSIFNDIHRTIAGFVEDNVEREDVKERWAQHLKRYDLDSKVRKALEQSFNRCQNKIRDIFEDLGKDLSFVGKLSQYNSVSGGGTINNWKRIWGWGSALAGAGTAIAFLLSSNPIGWTLTGISILFGLFSWFSSSREKKLISARKKLYDNISSSLNKTKEKTISRVLGEFDKIICSGMQKKAFAKLCIIERTLLTVLNVERRCAMEYCAHHANISKQLIETVLSFDTINPASLNVKIKKTARIPGKIIVIVMEGYLEGKTKRFISAWMGCNEHIETVSLRTNLPIHSQLSYLSNKYAPDVSLKLKRLKSNEEVIYAPKVAYSQEQLDGIDIIQQILSLPVILSNI